MLRAIFGVSLALLLVGCAGDPKPSVIRNATTHKADNLPAKHQAPCPCSPTANQVVQKRWYDGFKVRWFH